MDTSLPSGAGGQLHTPEFSAGWCKETSGANRAMIGACPPKRPARGRALFEIVNLHRKPRWTKRLPEDRVVRRQPAHR